MQLLGADAHFCAEAELATIGEAGRGIPVNRSGVHKSQKLLRVVLVRGNNRLGMLRGVAIYVLNGFLKA